MIKRIKAAWAILGAGKNNGWAIIRVDRNNTYLLADMSPDEMLDAATHLADVAGTAVKQESAVSEAMELANGSAKK